MANKEVFRDDLLNRFPGYTFTETAVDDLTNVEFRDGGDEVVNSSKKLDALDSYKDIRKDILKNNDVKFRLTQSQIDALIGIDEGVEIWNTTTDTTNVRSSSSWVAPTAGAAVEVFKSYTISDYGNDNTNWLTGFYEGPTVDVTLTMGGTETETLGTAGLAVGAHAFCVASGAGGTDLVLTVTGVSITDSGVRNDADTEVLVADTDAATTDQYFETTKRWLGQITYTLTGSSGAFTFNYGFAEYEDFGNHDFTVTDFEMTGKAGGAVTDLDITLIHHKSDGWTYAATGFIPGSGNICDMAVDYGTNDDLSTGEPYFAYKRKGLSTLVTGSGQEGILVRINITTNNAIDYGVAHVGVTLL